jgi:hypothetical protein
MSQHAPGPWRVQPYVDAIDILDANEEEVAYLADRAIAVDGMPPENARLIAAAPDLLAACEAARELALVGTIEGRVTHEAFAELLDAVVAAIARAKGGTT